jgi:hypothetical protein
MSENAGGGKAFSVNAAIALARYPSVDSEEQDWTGSRHIVGCLFCVLGDPMNDVEGWLEGRNHPVILER